MARRSNRAKRAENPPQPEPKPAAREAKPQAAPRIADPAPVSAMSGLNPDRPAEAQAPVSMPIILTILCSFAALAALVLALGWPGYQLTRRTAAAERAIDERRYADAIPHLRHITRRHPGAWTRLTQLGDCLLEREEAAEALAAYEKSIKAEKAARAKDPLLVAKNKNPQDLRAKMGRAHYLLGHTEEAVKLLQDAIKSSPADPDANYYIGLIYMKQNEPLKAAFCFQAATAKPELREKAKPLIQEIRAAVLGEPAA